MAKIVHKQKGPFGETIYTDENFRVIGTSHKGLFGEEVFLDKDFRYAGSKQKGLLGEDVYLDKDYHVNAYGRQGLGGRKIIVDKDGKYIGWGGKGLGDDEIAFLDGGGNETEGKPTAGAWIFLICVFVAIILIMKDRHYIGIDKEEKYVQLSKRNIENFKKYGSQENLLDYSYQVIE